MTVDEIKDRVAEIQENKDDGELAHVMEDGLYHDFVRAAAYGDCEDPMACALVLLLTEDIPFDKWYT